MQNIPNINNSPNIWRYFLEVLPKIERTSPVIPIKEVNHSNLLLIHKPYIAMSFLMFHSGNIPIIEEDDMKLVELVIKNNNQNLLDCCF